MTTTELNTLTSQVTCFKTFEDLMNAKGYFPTLRVDVPGAYKLADWYDNEMQARNDPRRANRS